MKIHPLIQAAQIDGFTVATIGTFDGVHNGHREIIRRLTATAVQSGLKSLILTFFPHPRMVIGTQDNIKLLNTLDERTELLSKTGLDHLIVHPFDEAFSSLDAEEFVREVLVNKLRVRKVIVGHDHRFGKNRSAGFDDLVVLGEKYGFEVGQIEAEKIDSVSVSSTKIRNALSIGDMPLANRYLGYEYFLTGTIAKGKQLGRTIGFPTANLEVPEPYKLIPARGVYIVWAQLGERKLNGVMNIGTRPTVSGEGTSVEIHLLDFDGDIYDQQLTVFISMRIRDEIKFDSVTELKAQIAKDVVFARAYLAQK